MVSKLQIINMALATVGADKLDSLDEDNHVAETVELFYETTRERLLEEHTWNCAIAREEVVRIDLPWITDWDCAFALPDDCIRVLKLNSGDDFHVEGGYILANVSEAIAKYIKDLDVSEFSAHLARTFQYGLAVEFANVFAQNINLSRQLEKQYRLALSRAQHLDSLESFGDTFTNSNEVDYA